MVGGDRGGSVLPSVIASGEKHKTEERPFDEKLFEGYRRASEEFG